MEEAHLWLNFVPEKCVGCGACVSVCPPGLVSIADVGDKRIIEFVLGSCTYTDCVKCVEICPEKAISAKEGPSLLGQKEEPRIRLELPMVKCECCGTPFSTKQIVDKVATCLPKEVEIEAPLAEWLTICASCRLLEAARKVTARRSQQASLSPAARR
jgi:NAD-dependent dihydropyrimidine dehydrogenase PreA subunit